MPSAVSYAAVNVHIHNCSTVEVSPAREAKAAEAATGDATVRFSSLAFAYWAG